MGTFLGHVVPGAMITIYALWTMTHVLRRYFRCKQTNTKFVSSIWYPCDCGNRLKTFPTEAIIKFVFASVGITGEIYTGTENGRFIYYGNGHHSTMFFFFGITGVVDILYYYNCPLPPGLDYACNWLAFYVEGVLFNFHLHGRSELDVTIHTCLIYCIVVCAISVIMEAVFRSNIIVALCRPYFTMLQGTWFFQISFILYNPFLNANNWDLESAESVSLAVVVFVLHIAAVFISMVTLAAIIGWYYRHLRADFEYESKPLIFTDMEDIDKK